ncbi:MAG: ABC transporter ATP-binding protein [Chloroflexi bacterium]|nr:ABC transporter ATP-binding protein [Chloroflexota bacterium]
MSETFAIKTEGLIKSYGSFQALYGVDLEVQKGEIFGFLGPNGAGKTTTIRCLLDTIHRNGGSVSVMGIDPLKDPVAVRALVGYLPGELSMEANQTGEKLFRYFNQLRGGKAEWDYIREMAKRLDLDIKRPVKTLSHGNKQKIGVIQAFMHRPELLILDEPTSGLDPLMQQEVLRLVEEAQSDGATIFFSSHIMGEIQAVADKVGIIRAGRIIEVAETSSLIGRSLNRATVRFKQSVDVASLANVQGVTVLGHDDGTSVTVQVEGEMDGLIKALAGFPVLDFETQRPSLEEIFLAYYKDGTD